MVTGGTGFIGRCLVELLLAAGHEVVALVRDPAAAAYLTELGAILERGDICEKSSLAEPMDGVDGLFHLAGWVRFGERLPNPAFATNVIGTRNVLETARDLGVAKIVYTSTVAIFSDTKGALVDETYRHDGPYLNEYERTKAIAHYRVAQPMAESGLPLVIVQPRIVYGCNAKGSFNQALRQYLQGRLPMVPKGMRSCWGHVQDTAEAIRLAMEKGRVGESYLITGPVHSLREVFAIAESITGIKAPRFHPGPPIMRSLAALMRVAGGLLPVPPVIAAETLRSGAGTTYIGSNRKARSELGFTPRPLQVGLRDTLQYEMRLLGMEAKKCRGNR